jgi:hypothetical protein
LAFQIFDSVPRGFAEALIFALSLPAVIAPLGRVAVKGSRCAGQDPAKVVDPWLFKIVFRKERLDIIQDFQKKYSP